MTSPWLDLRFALRMLARHPGTTAIVVVTLGLGVGLTTAMYGFVHGVLGDLPYEDSDRLFEVQRTLPSGGVDGASPSVHDWRDWSRGQESFESLAAFVPDTVNLADGAGQPERFAAARVSPDLFPTLRVEAVEGRTFGPDEIGPTAPPVILIGHRVWRSRYGSDPAVIGRTVRLDGAPHTIVGVLPEGFRFPTGQEVWLPLEASAAQAPRGEGARLSVFGRLAEGVSPEQARTDLATIAARIAAEHPDTNDGVGVRIRPWIERFLGPGARTLLYTMLGAVLGVLLIACANVANLLLARTIARGRETAIRAALGAGRWRLVSQLLTETALLAVAGTGLGLVLAAAALETTNRVIADTNPPYWLSFELDAAVIGFAALLALGTTLLAGLLPALRAAQGDPGEVLSEGGRGSSGGPGLGRLSRALVVAEVAGSCALLVVAGLMVQTIVEVDRWDHGFEPAGLFTARVALPETGYPEPEDRRRFFERLEAALDEAPQIERAGLTTDLPVSYASMTRFETPATAGRERDDLPRTRWSQVGPGFFDTLDARVLAGRSFAARDRADARPVAVVNRPFAERVFPDGDAVGQRIRLTGGPEEEPVWRTIVGIVPDLSMAGPEQRVDRVVYLPLGQTDSRSTALVVRPASGEPPAITGRVRSLVAGLDSDLPIYAVQTQETAMREVLWHFDFFGGVFLVFGLTALVMAAVGLYGVMAFHVGRRTREVGVRLALGATSGQVLGLMMRQGTIQVLLGLVLGLPMAFALARLAESVLFRVEPWSPPVFGLVVVVLLAAGLLAVFVPARRAAKVDPQTALRAE